VGGGQEPVEVAGQPLGGGAGIQVVFDALLGLQQPGGDGPVNLLNLSGEVVQVVVGALVEHPPGRQWIGSRLALHSAAAASLSGAALAEAPSLLAGAQPTMTSVTRLRRAAVTVGRRVTPGRRSALGVRQ
jgi:hypothetical protein